MLIKFVHKAILKIISVYRHCLIKVQGRTLTNDMHPNTEKSNNWAPNKASINLVS